MESSEELPVREGYAAWSPYYDDDGNPLIALEGPAMQGWFGPVEGRRALDLGCGTGRHTLALVEADDVTLCYQRPRRAGWRYNLFSMIHGCDRNAVRSEVAKLADRLGPASAAHEILFSRRCFRQRGARLSAA